MTKRAFCSEEHSNIPYLRRTLFASDIGILEVQFLIEQREWKRFWVGEVFYAVSI